MKEPDTCFAPNVKFREVFANFMQHFFIVTTGQYLLPQYGFLPKSVLDAHACSNDTQIHGCTLWCNQKPFTERKE